jgi:hypothetical protein
MSLRAPLRVPVELKRQGRWFRLACAVSLDAIELSSAMPEGGGGPLDFRFPLPVAAAPLVCHGVVEEQVVGEGDEEHAERRRVRFLDLDEDGATRIQAYVQERLGIV